MTPRHVLVVEDNRDLRDLVCAVIEDEGLATRCAASGAEALTEFATGRVPSLVLLDVGLPDMNGLAVLEALRTTPALRGVPVVLASGTRISPLPEGVVDLLFKPYLPDAVVDIVCTHAMRTTERSNTSPPVGSHVVL